MSRITHRSSVVQKVCVAAIAWLAALPAAFANTDCGSTGVALQVRGSGGPFGNGRASAGYLVWIDGSARIMIDAGGGTFTRFHETPAKIDDLELLALSHFHPDHSAEIPALLWIRPTDMLLAGPTGGNGYPSADEYVAGLFGPEGVFRAVTNGKGMRTVTIDVDAARPTILLANDSLKVTALGVPHGIVPAVAYRVDVGDASIVFSSDQNGSDPNFVDFASRADLLVVHLAIAENQIGFAAHLHAKPSIWGQIASDADVGTLVLSHLTGVPPRSADGELQGLTEKLGALRSRYDGPLEIAEDLKCFPIAR